ncbi:DNA methyltransferase [Rhizobium wenxiniae]|uniref:DNA methyltransferase n=1 Tax=Rhizobium wenxiniae TaxID=1737357 RepID=UPI003C29614A
MSNVTLYAGDNRETLRQLIDKGVRVHSVCTDAPYGLVSIQKRFSKEGAAPAKRENTDGSFSRLSGGFMGKKWDGTGIERDPEFWKLIYDILLPGGYVFAFSGSRTGHWQAVAMELAGFIMHPMHGWCFGSGLPKGHAADKAIDKMLGVKGGFIAKGAPVKRMIPGADQNASGSWLKEDGREYQPGTYVPASEEAREWSGWAYGTQTQKPALEPIFLGQKPFSEKNGAANLRKHGVGAMNVADCKVPGAKPDTVRGASSKMTAMATPMGEMGLIEDDGTGRVPSNLILDGSPEVVAMFPAKAGARAPASVPTQTGKSKSGSMAGPFNGMGDRPAQFHSDEGSAARFFHQFPRFVCDLCEDNGQIVNGNAPDGFWVETCSACDGAAGDLPPTLPLIYHSKAAKVDRAGSKHPTVKPIALMQYLVRHITPPGGTVLDPFAGSGTTAEAAKREGFNCILMEAEDEYVDFLRQRFADLVEPNEEISLSLEGDDESLFPVCSLFEKKGINSYPVDLSDLIGSTIDLSDLL